MTVATILPFVPAQWFTSAGDAVLSGGQLWFYEIGTTTPKEVYSDYEATTPHAQPVILSASGKATVFLGAGGYKVVLKDALGAVMDTVDGVFGSGGTAAGGSIQTTVATFADLRALTNPGEVVTVLVSGALAQGDGGGGAFTFDPDISATDDGGVIIAPTFGVGRWVRSVSSIPAISWWGIKGLTTESDEVAIGNAFAYCSAQNCSLIIDRHNVGLRVNATFSGSKLIFSGGDFYTASSPATVTMSGGAMVEADPHDLIISGGGYLNYGAGQAISPEWTSAALDASGIALAVASAGTRKCRLVLSSTYACASSIVIPDTLELDFSENGRISFTATASLAVGRMAYAGRTQVFAWDAIAHVGAVAIGAPEIFPEWFGAVGDGLADDSVAFFAAAKTGRINLASAGNYLLGPLWSATPTPLAIRGGTVTLSTGKTLGTGFLALDSVTIIKASGGWFAGSFLQAINSEFPQNYTAAAQSITGCKYTGFPLLPVFAGSPYLENAHLDILGAQLLGTDADGKIQDAGRNIQLSSLAYDRDGDGGLFINGNITLTNPLPLIHNVANSVSGQNLQITLPDATGENYKTAPNVFMLMAQGSEPYTVISPGFGQTFVHNSSMILFRLGMTNLWYVLKGVA